MSSMEQDFLDALSSAGIPPTAKLVLDGNLKRYNIYGDKKGRRNGWYRFVRARDDFAWGVFGCNKRGISEKWASKDRKEFTAYDNKVIKKRKLEIEKQFEADQAKAALKANQLWDRLENAGEHSYALKKGIRLSGVRKMHNALVIPLYADNYIVSLQFISPEGEKRYLTNGQKRGAYYWVGPEGKPEDPIYIAEGYATACSIYEAIDKQVVVAFDSGNLLPVAEAMRSSMPEKKIIIAADNDQWTIGNPGMSKAQEAADKIGAKVIWAPFNPEDKNRPTDWNDYHKIFGLRALAEQLMGITKVHSVPVIAEEKRWRTMLLPGKEERTGYPSFDSKSKYNAYQFLLNHENFKTVFAYNIFTDTIFMLRCPPWEDAATFTPREVEETDAAMCVKELEFLGVRVSKEVINDYIQYLAKKSTINPPRDFFDSVIWDGKHRLDNWLTYYLGAEKQPADYLALVGTKWLMGAVSRVYRPGAKFDNVLVLEGAQGKKKTMAFEVLSTFQGEKYFLEFMGDIGNKDSLALMQGKIIVEMSELASVHKSAVESMKAFVSRPIDEYRPPYARHKIKRPRMFVLAGTTNKVGQEYLEDETGARRIWPVECGDNIDIESLKADAPQLWAEAIARYKAGERTWLEGDEVDLAKLQQSERQIQDAWEEKISFYLKDCFDPMTVTRVCEGIQLQTKDMTNNNFKKVKQCLKNLGWKEHRGDDRENGRVRIWKKAE